MIRSRVQPNGVTFLGVLSACAHGGLVDEGLELFRLMICDYRLEPNVDHYGCMMSKWEAAANVRRLMKGKGVDKSPGCSWIEVNGVIHEFIAFDKSHTE
ncbi:Pentatricopeptide repeat-containing protein [Vitis vinifera]|uniref:Pentatricopeptide repeat-containing protein n=1 Tax=Vitis vinifera TaxID=29760 RepID=A0A438J748_VITVI|nr:Pentatricopeptide repeat-containing protein [Vitis vinifera]